MTARIRIRGGRIVDPANRFDAVADLYIDGGRIVAVGRRPRGFATEEVLDARGLIVCPGLVDLSARLREPGYTHKATIASELKAAVAGGVTTLCCPPDTLPIIDTTAVVELIHQRAATTGLARVVCLGALTRDLKGEMLAGMNGLKSVGCVGVSNALAPVVNSEVMRRALEYAHTCGLTVFIHAEDPWLAGSGHVHEGAVSTRLGLPGIPETAETVALSRDLLLVEQSGARAHFCRLSCARSARLVAEAAGRGLPVTADVAIHQLFLTDADLGRFDSFCHVRPPLRGRADRDGLRRALRKGVISAICSDHQPHDPDAKRTPFDATEPGISALETWLPLTLRLVDEGLLDLNAALATVTANPAAILGVDAGTLGVGASADVCIFDPDETWRLDEKSMVSAGRNTPFLDQTFRGRVRFTLHAGRVVYSA
jgi:dihydroorotase